MHSLTHRRLSLLALACGTALTLASPAYALYTGTTLTGDSVPDWAVGNFSCSGTLISPRVVVTAEHCLSDTTSGFYHRKTGQVYYGRAIKYPERYGPLGDVGIVITDTKFGGSGTVQTANIPSYAQEKEALSGENVPQIIYARDNVYGSPFTTARTTDAYRELPMSEGLKMVYKPIMHYRQNPYEAQRLLGLKSPSNDNIFNQALAGLMYTDPDGLKLTDEDVDAAVVTVVHPLYLRPANVSPISSGDSGGSIFTRLPDGKLGLIGNISGVAAHPRLSSYWPWVVKNLITNGLREDALLLSRKVLGTGNWGDNDRKAAVGQIFVYDNPYSGAIEYFRLASAGSDGRYWYFPTDRRDNRFWEYLGTQLPDIEQATTPIGVWGENGRQAKQGQVFIYNNPYTYEVEYFRANATGQYWYFPTDKTNNTDWTYLGTNLPTKPMKYVERIN